LEECGPYHVFAGFTLAFSLQLREKHGNPSVRVAIYKHIIRIHSHNNKTLAQDGGRWRVLVEKDKTL
jgi:hypothetical protein